MFIRSILSHGQIPFTSSDHSDMTFITPDQREATEAILKSLNVPYSLKPNNDRFIVEVKAEDVSKKMNQESMFFFLCLYMDLMKAHEDEFNKQYQELIDKNPQNESAVILTFTPRGLKFPSIACFLFGKDNFDENTSLLLNSQKKDAYAPIQPLFRNEEYTLSLDSNLLSGIVFCRMSSEYLALKKEAKALQEEAKQTPYGLLFGISEMIVDYISPRHLTPLIEKIDGYIKAHVKSSPDGTYEFTLKNIHDLVQLFPNNLFKMVYSDLFDKLTDKLKSQDQRRMVARKFCSYFLRDQEKFPKERLLKLHERSGNLLTLIGIKSAAMKQNELFGLKEDTIKALDDGLYQWNLSKGIDEDSEKKVLASINSLWEAACKNKENPYYKSLAEFFYCQAYEKEFSKSFPDTITPEILQWLIGYHIKEMENKNEVKL